MSNIGTRIRIARQEAGLSQDQLGDAVGLTGKTIRRYEKGYTIPDSSFITEIAEATGRPASFFVPALPPEEEGQVAVAKAAPPAPATLDAPRPLSASQTVQIRCVEIQHSRLEDAGETAPIPWGLLRRADRPAEQLRVLRVPRRHYSLLRYLHPSDALILDPLHRPIPLDAYLQSGEFVDGQYLVGIGFSSLQVKTIATHPDETVTIESVDGTQRFRYQTAETSGVVVHALVVMAF